MLNKFDEKDFILVYDFERTKSSKIVMLTELFSNNEEKLK